MNLLKKFNTFTRNTFNSVKERLEDFSGKFPLPSRMPLNCLDGNNIPYCVNASYITLIDDKIAILDADDPSNIKIILKSNLDSEYYWMEGSDVKADWENLMEIFDTILNARPKNLKKCFWHGCDAWILGGNAREGYTLLVSDYSLQEANFVKLLSDRDAPLGDYSDFIVFAEPEEYKEQNYL